MSNDNVSTAVQDELLNLADSNWVLGHWYLLCILNSRGLQDASAMSAMAQDSLGHTRATLHFLEQEYGYEPMTLEFNRNIDQVHGMDLLDKAPESWGDFVATLALAEHAVWQMMATFDNSSIPAVGGMLEAFGQENQFHRMNMDGWIKIFSDEEREQVRAVLPQRLGRALAWFGTEDASANDPLLEARVRSRSVWSARGQFIAAVSKSLGLTAEDIAAAEADVAAGAYDNGRRRPEGSNMPAQLWEALVPTSEEAKLARRPLEVSITDELDLYDRPNSKNWDFEPIAI